MKFCNNGFAICRKSRKSASLSVGLSQQLDHLVPDDKAISSGDRRSLEDPVWLANICVLSMPLMARSGSSDTTASTSDMDTGRVHPWAGSPMSWVHPWVGSNFHVYGWLVGLVKKINRGLGTANVLRWVGLATLLLLSCVLG